MKHLLIFLGRLFGFTTTYPTGMQITEVNTINRAVRLKNTADRYIDLNFSYLEFTNGKSGVIYTLSLRPIILEPYQQLVILPHNNPLDTSSGAIYIIDRLLTMGIDQGHHIRLIHRPTDDMIYGKEIIHEHELF